MIVADRFVYLHMHRTAGTFLRQFFRQFFPDSREVGYHYPLPELPPTAAHLPVFIVARDPMEWYRSVYRMNLIRMGTAAGAVNPVLQETSQRGQLNFQQTLEGLLRLGENTPTALLRRRRIAASLPSTLVGNRGVGLTRDDIQHYVSDELGYYSWLFLRMVGGKGFANNVQVLRHEEFKTALPGLLESYGVTVTQAMRQHLLEAPSLNISPQQPSDLQVSDLLQQLVAQKDAWVFQARGLAAEQYARMQLELPRNPPQ